MTLSRPRRDLLTRSEDQALKIDLPKQTLLVIRGHQDDLMNCLDMFKFDVDLNCTRLHYDKLTIHL